MKKLLLMVVPLAFGLLFLMPQNALALGGNEYVMSSQADETFLCANDWETCFTHGAGQSIIPLGKGSGLGDGTLLSVTIAKDENSPSVSYAWIVRIECFTDPNYDSYCTDWVHSNAWNGFTQYFVTESATTTTDSKHWTAYFTNPSHEVNNDNSSPVLFNPNYYYRLVIDDGGFSVGAYGSQSLGLPYYKITGIKSKPDPVIIIPGILGSWEKNGQWILDPLLHTYDNLIDTLVANGYVKDQTLFTLPYDWEEPNEVTATLLKNKIAEVKKICSCDKVDLIGHSMGGLVAASYIESSSYANDVDQLFFLTTPLSGSPKAYKVWEGGIIDFGDAPTNIALRINFGLEALQNDFSSIYSYIHGKPVTSVQELLPVNSDYLKIGVNVLHFPTGYPQNGFLQNLVTNFSKIFARGVTINTILADTKNNSTIGGFTIASSTQPGLWEDGQPIATTFNTGDGTVPRSSIENVASVDKEFDLETHMSVASTSSAYLYQQMTGLAPSVIVGKRYNIFTSALTFKLFSPIDMIITAPDGKKLGKDFSSNIEVNEIPNAFYSGFTGDDEYAVIPNPLPGDYKVDTIGTGSGGHYTIAAEYADTSTSSIALITGTSTPSVVENHDFIFSATSSTVSLPPLPVATSTPTTTALTPDTCVTDITQAHKDKWIGKKSVADRLILDCKALKKEFEVRDSIDKTPANKLKLAQKLLLAATNVSIRLTLANMEVLARDRGNTKDAVSLIIKYITWFKDQL